MKITNKSLKTAGAFTFALGAIVSIFFEPIQNYIIIISILLGMIIMMPWIKEKDSD